MMQVTQVIILESVISYWHSFMLRGISWNSFTFEVKYSGNDCSYKIHKTDFTATVSQHTELKT